MDIRNDVEGRCALILAGGRSSRMGRDKAKMQLQGHTMLERAAAFWLGSGRVSRVLVAFGQEGHFEALPEGVTGIPDLEQGRGPMAGILSAFKQTDAELLYVSAVDMPGLSGEMILPEPEGDAIVYRKDGRAEPLFGIYRRSAAEAAERLLKEGNGRMTALLEAIRTTYVDAAPETMPAFDNLNTLPEMQRARAGTPPMIAVVGWHNSGKTTFLEGLIPALKRLGIRVCITKHDAHGFQMDTPGKDTFRLREAGAEAAGIIGPNGWAVVSGGEMDLERMRQLLPACDLILAEGFKFSPLPKVEVHRQATGKPLATQDDTLAVLITDEPMETAAPQLGLTDFDACAALLKELFLL